MALDYSQRHHKSKYALIFTRESCTINILRARAVVQESVAGSSALVRFETYKCFTGGFTLMVRIGDGYAEQQVEVLYCWSWGADMLCCREK